MSGFGQTLRNARLARRVDLAACSAATGIGPKILEALEREDLDSLPPAADAADLVGRYARYLECDADALTDEVQRLVGDDEADTQRIPVVRPPRRTRDAGWLWIGAGAALGIGVLVVLGGGLGGDSPDVAIVAPTTEGTTGSTTPPQTTTPRRPSAPATTSTSAPTTTTTTAPTTSATTPDATTLRPGTPAGTAIELRLDARAGKTVWVEVRRDDVNGEQVFAGIVGGGAIETIRSERPLWLGVAWAPNVALTLNGEEIDAEGGTESYRVTARGVTLL